MNRNKFLFIFFSITILLFSNNLNAQNKAFKCIVLGNSGGYEGNLSSYMLSNLKTDNYICLDAGTLYNGIKLAIKEKSFGKFKLPKTEKLKPEVFIMRNYIKGYLITHTHLDHIAALVINAPDENRKYIYGMPHIIENFNKYIFNWTIAANFGSEGEGEILQKFKYITLPQGNECPLIETDLSVTPFYTSHYNNYLSSAFLIRSNENYFLYFGDTGSDESERNNYLSEIWDRIAPLIREKKINAIMIECSYPNEQPENMLYGHLNPSLLTKELNQLAKKVNERDAQNVLKDLKIIISHIKPSVNSDINMTNTIKYQLENANNLNVNYIFPEQGERIEF
jgi:3',5'-cyclic-nucleotide phosphodiesterase